MHVAMISPIAWRTPPRHYGPWELIVSLLTEGLVERGIEVTLFATEDSLTNAHLVGVCPKGYEEDKGLIPKVWECFHISEVFERLALIKQHQLVYSAITDLMAVANAPVHAIDKMDLRTS